MILECFIDPIKQLFIEPIVRFIKSAIADPLERNISYPFTYRTNIENLRKQVRDLTPVRDDLQRNRDQVNRRGDGINSILQIWLDDAQRALQNAQNIIQEEDKTYCSGMIPNLGKRYLLSSKAEDESKVLQELQDRIPNSGEIWFRSKLEASSSARGDEHLESRSSILEQVMAALADPQINVVGVWGMGGVGKTTLAEQVKKQAKQANSYGLLFMATASPTPDLDSIQQQLAEMVDLKIQEQTSEGKALRMEQTLMKTERILIILDDVWEKFPFEKIGIPRGSDHKGCKLLLTSRSKRVLSSMDTQRSFMLDLLLEREAWSLFSRTVGEFKSDEVRELATKVAEKCGGLPLLMDVAAKALKDEEIHEWRNALKKLSSIDAKKGSLEELVYPVLELSYSQLRDNEMKPFFLLCGQLGRSNILIEDLLKYSIALDLLQGSDETMKDRRDALLTWISCLKAYSLLLDSNLDGHIKIHDLVRDTALRIASENQHLLAVKSGALALREWPKEEVLKNSITICLPHCDFQDLPERFGSPEAEFLMLGFNYHSLRIPDSFFESVRKLKVLHFSKIIFPSLPKSLGSLITLCTLYFDHCELHDVAIIGELKDLEILSFATCIIRHLPKAIGQLSRLKLLDLSNCKNLKSIPANVLSSLSELEDLYMIGSFSNWEEGGLLSNQRKASLNELFGLSRLTTLELEIPAFTTFPKALFTRNLATYKIYLEGITNSPWFNLNDKCPNFSRELKLSVNKSIYKEPWIKLMMKETEALTLDVGDGIRDISFDQGYEIFPQLKYLHVENGPLIQCIVNSGTDVPCKAFPVLKFLYVVNMPELEKICRGGIAHGSFENLTTIKIYDCNNLKNLFTLPVVRGISRLQILDVSRCESLEEIFVDARDNPHDDGSDEVVGFSHLRELTLSNLPQLKSFCCGVEEASDHENVSEVEIAIFNQKVAFPVLEKLYIYGLNNVENIWHSQLVANSFGKLKSILISDSGPVTIFPFDVEGRFLMLEELEVRRCYAVKQICQPQEDIAIEETPIFPSLKTLNLNELRSLSNFNPRNGNFQCPSLKKIHISGCPQVKKFVSPFSMEQTLRMNEDGRKEQLEQEEESFFNHKVPPNLEELSLDYTAAKMILQSQLPIEFLRQIKFLRVDFNNKTVVSLSGMLQRFPNLEKLHLEYFALKEELFGYEELGFDKENSIFQLEGIRELELGCVSNLKHIWKLYPFIDYLEIIRLECCYDLTSLATSSGSFQYLTTLKVFLCNKLKNLITPSVAKSMVQLVKMTVDSCDELVEIVNNEQGGIVYEIVFEKLKILELLNSKHLGSFCSSSGTLKFPSLEQVIVERCPNMKVFSQGESSTPKLRRVLLSRGSLDDWHWKGNLNDTIEHIFVEMCGSRISGVSRKLLGKLSVDNFNCWEHLGVCDCGLFPNAIPFNVLQGLGNLRSLAITKGDSIEELFDLEDLKVDEEVTVGLMSNLVAMSLSDLPNLRHVWNPDPHEVLGFKNLQNLQVHNCNSLKIIFTLSMAVGLTRLQSIEVKGCMLLEQIITKEAELDNSCLPSLHSISLEHLPRLTGFYSGSGILHCPSLKEFDVINCPKLKLSDYTFSSLSIEEDKETLSHRYPDVLIENQVAIPSLEELTGDWQNLREIYHKNFGAEFFSKLKSITLMHFFGECPNFPSDFLLRFPNLEKMILAVDDSLEEIFLHEISVSEEKYLKLLGLSKLRNLKHLAAEDSPTISAFQYLEAFVVSECNRLKILMPSSVSFHNLSSLRISECSGLINLMAFSAAASLGQLEKMDISGCEMLEEIVASEGDDVHENEIVFKQLKVLVLYNLPCLASFSSGNYAFHFPSLEAVRIQECYKMQLFARGELSTPKLLKIKTWEYYSVWHGSLNSTIQEEFIDRDEEISF